MHMVLIYLYFIYEIRIVNKQNIAFIDTASGIWRISVIEFMWTSSCWIYMYIYTINIDLVVSELKACSFTVSILF